MNNDFLTCKKCDFEWHKKDGSECPVCNPKIIHKNLPSFENGGMFGTGPNQKRLGVYYKAVGLIALVYLIYFLLGG
jgi:DNA-directed RNA polymerase subunit RPC12/RpoP